MGKKKMLTSKRNKALSLDFLTFRKMIGFFQTWKQFLFFFFSFG